MKIVQILVAPNDSTWQGVLLGLTDTGETFVCGSTGKWEPHIPNQFVKQSDKEDIKYTCSMCGHEYYIYNAEENKCTQCGTRNWGHE